jgi:DNA-binding MarR family transcriptional regulator
MTKRLVREEVLGRVASPLRGAAGRRSLVGTSVDAPLSQDEIGFIIEGLSFAARPVIAAAEPINRTYDLGPRGAFILALVDRGVDSPMELASALAVGRSLITAELARLIDAALIDAQQQSKDQRRLRLSLTATGVVVLAQLRGALAGIVTDRLAAYGPDEIRLFAQMLHAVRQSAGGDQG